MAHTTTGRTGRPDLAPAGHTGGAAGDAHCGGELSHGRTAARRHTWGEAGRRRARASSPAASDLTTLRGMCRNIRQLYNFEPPASQDEVRAAALQYVRKISGFTKPSQANAEAFERAVDEIAHISAHLLDALVTNAPPKDREAEAAK